MKTRIVWMALCLLLFAAGVWFLRHPSSGRLTAEKLSATSGPVMPGHPAGARLLTNPLLVSAAEAKTNRLAYRLSNTPRTINDLIQDRRAILLENALIDLDRPVNFIFPSNLQSKGDPGAYIVQSRGPVTAAFRALLAQAGAQIVSYIPNNAYLVRLPAAMANALAEQPPVQLVLPYEPYYKIELPLLGPAVTQNVLPPGAELNLGLFADGAPQTIQQIQSQAGVQIVGQDTSPFGPVVRVQLSATANWTALADLPGVQIVEPYRAREIANDLSRVTVGLATNTIVPTNYMNLTGSNVMVEVDDSGIDQEHPDFTTGGSAGSGPGANPIRVLALNAFDLTDTNGHGTHVAGIIAGNGAMSRNPVNVGTEAEGSVSNADFRGKAPLATLFSMDLGYSDQALQEQAALTNALISNNSWGYGGDNDYDLAAASYDAATRDALPLVTGSQPVLFVFSAGNDGYIGQNPGNGDDNGGGGSADTITSPGTAKDVITVGALEQLRDITNIVTDVNSNQSAVWYPETDTGFQVAGYSSRGNVGVGIEGAYGRFKPDVAAPGTFVVSTSSQFNNQWATNAYYNPTNYSVVTYSDQIVSPGNLNYYSLIVPENASSVTVQVYPNPFSSSPFPTNLEIFVSEYNYPDPTDSSTYDFVVSNNEVIIPPDGPAGYLAQIQGVGFNFAVYDPDSSTIDYNVTTSVALTNDYGNFYSVLQGMNNSLGGYYRYESGTSMAAADVSGVLALMDDFFTNTLGMIPSPALLKAMLINGARPTGLYNLQVDNTINYEGWGLVNLPNTLPTNNPALYYTGGTPTSMFFQDQSPTNALATGDSHTYTLTTLTNMAALRVTVAWTDPPGDPIAALKLVNSLELVVTNTDNPTNPIAFYGNDIGASADFNTPESPTNPPAPDAINNVLSVLIPAPLGTNYTIAVIGRDVNVNAVSAQTNIYAGAPGGAGVYAPNIVQDYALVVSSGNGGAPGAFTITDNGIVSNPTGGQDITLISTTNTYTSLLDQLVGANSPVLNTNYVPFTANTAYGAAQDTTGTTNQWHFFILTNTGPTADYTNAAFVIYSSATLSVPRMGVFAGSNTNATLPSANLDLYVSTDPTITNLNPVAVSNCINQFGTNAASLGPGGAKFVVFTNSVSIGANPGAPSVYYVGVKSEDQMAGEFNFLGVFSQTPFDANNNGDEILNGLTVPVAIPGGTPSVPGYVDVVAIGVQPINVGWVVVTNVISELDVGDLVSMLSFNNINVGLMSHTSPNSTGTFGFIYDDSSVVNPADPTIPSGYTVQGSDGPGNLQDFAGQNASAGVWVFHMANSVAPFTGSVGVFALRIHPQVPLTSGITNVIPPHTMVFNYVDVPAGATNLTVNSTNITPSPDTVNPLLMVLKFGAEPTLTNADKGPVALINGTPVDLGGAGIGNSLSVGPSDVPPIQPGRYWIGVTNQSDIAQTDTLIAVILPPNPSGATTDFASTGASALLDDAVTYSGIRITNTQPVISLNVGIEVQHPRISDLAFYLISPDGTRDLLMENRGGDTTNGAGVTITITNITTEDFTNSLASSAGDYPQGKSVAGWTVGTNMVSVVDDPLSASPGTQYLLTLASGTLTATFPTVPGQAYTVSFPYRGPGIVAWWRGESNLVDSINGNNGTAPTVTNYTTVWTNGFEGGAGNITLNAGTYFAQGWLVSSGTVDWIQSGTLFGNSYSGNYFIDLDGASAGTIITNVPTVARFSYTLSFAYTKNPNAVVTPQMAILINGHQIASLSANIANSFQNLDWQTTNYTFTALSPGTVLTFESLDPTNDVSGVFLDAVSVTTNIVNYTMGYTNGEVGTAFQFNGSNNLITVPASPSLTVSNLTLEAWIYPTDPNTLRPIFDGGGAGQYSTASLWLNTQNGSSLNSGGLRGFVRGQPPLSSFLEVDTANTPVSFNRWNHVAFSANVTTEAGAVFCNGVRESTGTAQSGPVIPFSEPMNLGYRNAQSSEALAGSMYEGNLDEMSIYQRPLSDSEVQAIYNLGTNGKFDPIVFSNSPALSLAEARVSLDHQPATTLYGNNLLWQTYSATLVATTNQTTLTVAGLEPGMLMGPLADPVLVTNVTTNVLYLTFTDDTNLTLTPIKFAVPPYVPSTSSSNFVNDGFEQTAAGDYTNGATFGNGWTVTTNEVSVVTDATNAFEGSNFLALAGGAIFTNLPTVAGQAYTLTFAYRGPGILSWWRGETNANDALGVNNGTAEGNLTYTNGEVGDAFQFDGSTAYVQVADPADRLNFDVRSNNFTVDCWVNLASVSSRQDFIIDRAFNNVPCSYDLYFLPSPVNQFVYDCWDGNINVEVPGVTTPTPNTWYHLAVTLDSEAIKLYVNGNPELGPPVPDGSDETIPANFASTLNTDGARDIGKIVGAFTDYTDGKLDEIQVFNRALSDSEIRAFYNLGGAGTFDPAVFATSPAQSLAEAQVSLDGQSQGTLYGNNTNWQVESITFTATQNGTPLSITGLEPGMLLDDFTLTQTPTNLYVQPEQSLDLFDGQSAYGLWQLEIQDDRAGAGLTNLLVSWQLQFVFADTNPIPQVLTGGIGLSNQFLPAGDIAWYQINVPATANYATNRLLFASAPVNVWFDTNSPPTTNILLLPDSAYPDGTNGSVVLSTTNAPILHPPPNIYDGQTYYLGVQNTNVFTVNYGIEVDFDNGNGASSPGFSAVSVSASNGKVTAEWTASPSAQFEMLWTTNLAMPFATWNTNTAGITSSNGVFTFTDLDATDAMRFYRLVQLSP